MTPEEAFEKLMMGHQPQTVPGRPALRRVIEPTPEESPAVGTRFFNLDITEVDIIDVTITMADGSKGNLQIKGTTLAQIILDRNARALPAPEPPVATNEIQVGDGDLPEGARVASKIVPAEDLLAASQKRTKPLHPLPLPPVQPLNPNSDAWTQRRDDWEAMVKRHGLKP